MLYRATETGTFGGQINLFQAEQPLFFLSGIPGWNFPKGQGPGSQFLTGGGGGANFPGFPRLNSALGGKPRKESQCGPRNRGKTGRGFFKAPKFGCFPQGNLTPKGQRENLTSEVPKLAIPGGGGPLVGETLIGEVWSPRNPQGSPELRNLGSLGYGPTKGLPRGFGGLGPIFKAPKGRIFTQKQGGGDPPERHCCTIPGGPKTQYLGPHVCCPTRASWFLEGHTGGPEKGGFEPRREFFN